MRLASVGSLVGIFFGGCGAMIWPVTFGFVDFMKAVNERVSAVVDQGRPAFWTWVAIGALAGLVSGIAMIRTALKVGPR
jgi:hypothetical protein